MRETVLRKRSTARKEIPDDAAEKILTVKDAIAYIDEHGAG